LNEFRGLQTPPVSWLGGLIRAAFPSGWPDTTSGRGLNFIATRARRSALVGSMNVRPM